MNHLFIVTHTDLDGVGSAAAYIRLASVEKGYYTVVFAEPYNLNEVLKSIEDHIESGDRLVIADLGPNPVIFSDVVGILRRLAEKGVEVEWYDHHVWGKDEAESVRAAGVKLFVDRETCATGVVVKYFPHNGGAPDEFSSRLARAVCAADLWRWDDPMAPKLFRVVGNRRDEDWKRRLIEKFSSGILWDEEMSHRLEDYVNLELEGMAKALKTLVLRGTRGRCLIAATMKGEGPPPTSMIGALLLSRFNADIAVIARPNGALSLRSRSVDVQVIAKALGGGGHPRAAGAKIDVPIHIRLLSLVYRKALPRYIAGVVEARARELGVCMKRGR